MPCILKLRPDRRTPPEDGGTGYLTNKADLPSYPSMRIPGHAARGHRAARRSGSGYPLESRLEKNKAILGLVGTRCRKCGTPQYPPQRICANPACGAVDAMEDYAFADKKGKILSYTGDMLAASYDPPELYGYVEMEGGGRLCATSPTARFRTSRWERR